MRPADDIERLFAAGDYMSVALHGKPNQWQYFAARGLITDPAGAARCLGRFDHPEARFYSAVLDWLDGNEDQACREWEKIDGPYAWNLLALARKSRIDVLSILPQVRHGAFVLAEGIAHDPKFRVRNIGPLAGDMPTRPYASIADYVDADTAPDFFVCNMIEWHQVPLDIGTLPCPTIGFTNDFDMHIQGVHCWYHAFDVMVVIDQVVEWPSICRISGVPTYAYPMVFGAPFDLPELRSWRRDIDVFMSGTMLSAYHPDKARLLHQLMAIPGVKILVIDGHLGVESYWDLLSRSKITPSFCRHPGGIQTRVIEALSMGSVALVQPESIMQLWADESDGLFVFDEETGPEPQIRRILSDYDTYAEGCRKNVGALRRAFEPRMVASRFFRFCAFIAARPGGRLDLFKQKLLNQKRVMFVHGPRLKSEMAITLAEQNSERMMLRAKSSPSAELFIARAREWMLLYADGAYYNEAQTANPDFLQKSIELGREAMAAVPDSLVARFNLLRTLLHFGTRNEVEEGVALAADTVNQEETRWSVDPREDIYPYDFLPQWFNYRRYLDAVVEALDGRAEGSGLFLHLLLASIHHYLAVIKGSLASAQRACALDREFPFYALTLAEMLIREEAPGSEAKAVEILLPLARHSMVAMQANRYLRAIEERLGRRLPGAEAMDAAFDRFRYSFLQTEHHVFKLFASYFKCDNLRTRGHHGVLVDKLARPCARPWLSFVVCGQGGVGCDVVLDSLRRQQMGVQPFEVLYVDCYGTPPRRLSDKADVVLSLNQREFLENRGAALQAVLLHVRSDVVAFVEPGEPLDPYVAHRLHGVFRAGASGVGSGRPSSGPKSLVIVRDGRSASPSGGRFVAARLSDVLAIGGLSLHEILQGDAPVLAELAARLERDGVQLLVDRDHGFVPGALPPWWQDERFNNAPYLIDIMRCIWPAVFDERRTEPALTLPAFLVESVNANNIVRCYNSYFVVPQSLGPINLEDPVQRRRPEILVARTLPEARALAESLVHRRPTLSLRVRRRFQRWIRIKWPAAQ